MIDLSAPTLRLRRRLRHSRNRLATLLISAGGIGVIVAVLAIGIFLAIEVLPLFSPARVTSDAQARPVAAERVAWMEVGADEALMVLDADGNVWRGSIADEHLLTGEPLTRLPLQGTTIVSVSKATDRLALGLDNGKVLLVPLDELGQPRWFAAHPYSLFADRPVEALALQGEGEQWRLAGRNREGTIVVLQGRGASANRFVLPVAASHLALGDDKRLVLADEARLITWSLAGTQPQRLSEQRAVETGQRITALVYLAGGETLLVGDSSGGVRRWLNVRQGTPPLLDAGPYRGLANGAITRLIPLPDRRQALALDGAGNLALYEAAAGQRWRGRAPQNSLEAATFSPLDDRMWWMGEAGLTALEISAEHARVSWETLWTPVLYEGHEYAQHRWQASTAGIESEARFGLAPLAWGTLKAAAWALLFAVPVALGAAMYSAVYMSSRLRSRIKPTLELMEALPGVVIGFVAGLVLAPYVERHLAGALALVVVLPAGILLGGVLWSRLPYAAREKLPISWAGLWLIPWLALLTWLSLLGSPWLESLLFNGDLRFWLEARLGLDYASRNAMIVGLAMGFAVIPTIYALAEDALAGVPHSLGEGAQALGATRWQALWRVLLPAASPGIFSAIMIGTGRAVGETMIVLMATGNTALMSWSPFEGLRSAAANIAIELPEAAVGGTHYRLLFLSALLLFIFTFCVNTLAEAVRQRLKRRYRHLGASP